MAVGFFGKLPSKRDFVSSAATRRFLDTYENWLQAGMASSRQTMEAAWQSAYLRMPIWRFWIGAAHGGATAMGAFMPSVDGVGRYFPMTVFALADGASFLPPELEPADGWYDRVETILLDALDPAAPFDRFAAEVAALPEPTSSLARARPAELTRTHSGAVILVEPSVGLAEAFTAARVEAHDVHYRSMVCLWTSGGDDFPPTVLVDGRLPDPASFRFLLEGNGFAATMPAAGRGP